MQKLVLILSVVLLVAVVSSSANACLLYKSNFNSGNLDDWTVMSAFGTWSLESGVLQVDSTGVGASQIKLDTVAPMAT